MTYMPRRWPGFSGGLNLRSPMATVGPDEALDATNVVFDQHGGVRSRDGYAALGSALTNAVGSLAVYPLAASSDTILAGCGSRLEAISNAGTVLASATGLTGSTTWTFANAGGTTHSAYAGNGVDAPRKYNGSVWSTPTATVDGVGGRAMPVASLFAQWGLNNRMAAVGVPGPNAVASTGSHVWFSEQGNPEAWQVTAVPATPLYANYVQITPGDGESINAMVAWGTQLFVFKDTKFAVFYGESIGNDGASPVFDYRMVETGAGCSSPFGVCAARDGVYFVARDGIYRTTGGPPVRVSDAIGPVFYGSVPTSATNVEAKAYEGGYSYLVIHNNQMWFGYPNGGGDPRGLMMDMDTGKWTTFDIHMRAMLSISLDTQLPPNLVFAGGSGLVPGLGKQLYQHGPAYTTDAGSAISSYWQSGFDSWGQAPEKTVREARLWGTGALTFALAGDYDVAHKTSTAVTFSGTGALRTSLPRNGMRASVHGLQITSTSAWSLGAVSLNYREARSPSVGKTD